MDPALFSLAREALLLTLLVSGPPLLAALLAGLAAGVVQAATQVQEPSLGVVPRLAAAFGALAAAGPWIAARLVRFASACLELAPWISP
ncbi:MAG TPA: flagellar biosynthetic protein FliQ [Anaeromyxobacteraceae bacterium]|nr:flagellar biosynthetic protein FliQ [Anaeromyxobacteraceae bacterium]